MPGIECKRKLDEKELETTDKDEIDLHVQEQQPVITEVDNIDNVACCNGSSNYSMPFTPRGSSSSLKQTEHNGENDLGFDLGAQQPTLEASNSPNHHALKPDFITYSDMTEKGTVLMFKLKVATLPQIQKKIKIHNWQLLKNTHQLGKWLMSITAKMQKR